MNEKVKKILQSKKDKTIGLFIDNANWFYPQKELGWRISFSKLRKFLEQYYTVVVGKIYAGTPLTQEDQTSFDRFGQAVVKSGFELITKPLKKIWIDRATSKFVHKCNFDVEIALDVARHIHEIDIAVIGSGDSDFLEIHSFAKELGKNFMVLCFERGVA